MKNFRIVYANFTTVVIKARSISAALQIVQRRNNRGVRSIKRVD